jgi:hypothetical protein
MVSYVSPPGVSLPADTDPILTLAYGPDLIRLWNRRANFLANCVEVRFGMFQNVLWSASTAGGASKAVPVGYDIQSGDYNIDNMVPLTLPRATLIDPFATADSEISIARRSPMSATPVMDLKEERLFESATRLTDSLNTRVLLGNGTDPVTGAQDLVGFEASEIVSGTYANQNVGVVTGLQGNVFGADGGSGTAITFAQMQSDLTEIKLRSDEKPEFIVMHPYVGSQVEALFETNRRIFNQDNTLKRYSTGPAEAFQGADSGMSFMGIPILYDKDMYVFGTPGDGYGHILYVTRKHNVLDIMPHFDVKDGSVWMERAGMSSGGWSPGDPLPFHFDVTSLARTGLASKFVLWIECQFANKRPLAQGKRLGVAI